MRNKTRRILLEAAVIFALGVVIGLSYNYRLVMNAFTGRTVPAKTTESSVSETFFPVPVDLESVRSLMKEGAVLVDARAREIYHEGHLPEALSFPLGEVEKEMPSFRGEVPPEAILVLYCSGYGCPDSFDLGVRLFAEGYRVVRVYEGGFPEWRDAGLPVERGRP